VQERSVVLIIHDHSSKQNYQAGINIILAAKAKNKNVLAPSSREENGTRTHIVAVNEEITF